MPEKNGFLSFGFRVFIYIFLAIAISNTLLYYAANYSIAGSYYEALVVLNVARHSAVVFSLTANAFVQAAALALIFLASLVMTHRISGPMYRFEKAAEKIAEGDLAFIINLREHDFMKPQAEGLNEAISAMRGKLAEATTYTAELKKKAADLERSLYSDGMTQEQVSGIVKGMKSDIEGIKDSLSHFKTR